MDQKVPEEQRAEANLPDISEEHRSEALTRRGRNREYRAVRVGPACPRASIYRQGASSLDPLLRALLFCPDW